MGFKGSGQIILLWCYWWCCDSNSGESGGMSSGKHFELVLSEVVRLYVWCIMMNGFLSKYDFWENKITIKPR